MQYGSSMFFGGQLIDAADADYNSYKDLGLLCPNCKEPIFLQAISQRQMGDTLTQIPAHFKHFKVKAPALVKECESRVRQYDTSEFQRRASQARNQRLKLLQRHFWGIFAGYFESEINVPMNSVTESLPNTFTMQMGQALSNNFLAQKIEYPKRLLRQFVSALFNNIHLQITWDEKNSNVGVNPCYTLQQHFRDSVSCKLDRQMQELITGEVLEFLHSKSSRPLVEKLFAVACHDLVHTLADDIKLGLIGDDGSDLVRRQMPGGGVVFRAQFWNIPKNREIFYFYAINHICLWLAIVPWAKQMKEHDTMAR